MATPVILVLAVVGAVCLVAILAVVSQLLARLRRVAADLRAIEADVLPRVDRLQQSSEVTGRELERVSRAIDELGDGRRARRDRSDGP